MNDITEKIKISTNEELQSLLNQFQNGPLFAAAFEFATEELWKKFAAAIDLNTEEFESCYHYFDKDSNVHIAQSEEGYVWISTMGLVAKSKITDNKYINACSWQKVILLHLLDDAILLSDDENTYDIDSCNYSEIENLTPALFHNTIFYFETFAKAYLSVNGKKVPRTHSLDSLLDLTKRTMFEKNQNNTLFHAHAVSMFEEIVKHIASIPGPFKEQYVKYDDNPNDSTLVEFNSEYLKKIRDIVEITCDMVVEMYYDPDNCPYLGKNLYQSLLNKCKTPEDKERLIRVYGFLLEKR